MGTPIRRKLTSIAATAVAVAALTGATSPTAAQTSAGSPGQLQHLPAMPVNICQNSSLPRDYGTNFPTPNDPHGFGMIQWVVPSIP